MCLYKKKRMVLTSNVEVVYIPSLYDSYGRRVQMGKRCENQDLAIEKGKSMVQEFVDIYGVWCYASIEQQIVPVYKKEKSNESSNDQCATYNM